MEEATTWAKCAGDQAAEDIDGRLPADYLSVRADLALLAGDLESARKFIGTMREHTPLYEAPRYRMTLLAYDQRLHAGDSRAVIDTELHSLLQWHQLAKAFGRHDDEMEALWVALNAHGEGALATELLSEYLSHHRRERRGPGYLLRRNTAGDPSWAQLLPKYLGTQTA